MKKIITILIAVLLIGCSSDEQEPIVMLTHTYTTQETDMLTRVNQYRTDHLLNTLNNVEHISGLCDQSNDYMISYNEAKHYYFQDRINNLQRLDYTRVSEIVAVNYSTNQSALNAMDQQEGCNKILNGDYTSIGVSIKESPSTGKKFYTLIFAK